METSQERTAAGYITRLDRTLQRLQDRVKEQEAALEKLRATDRNPILATPDPDSRAHLLQLRALTQAYTSLTPSPPYLPSPDSPLPALIAIRTVSSCIQETTTFLKTQLDSLAVLENRLEKENSYLHDAHAINSGLRARIDALKEDIESHSQKSPAQIAKEMQEIVREKKERYDSETTRLVKAFNTFIDQHLALMLAAEELGGPVVGDEMDVDEQMLEGGFSAKGKARRTSKNFDEDKRQRRIDQIWGPGPQRNEASGKEKEEEEEWTETTAAATEMRTLTEELLNSLVESEGAPGAYIEIERESAAARFLVRSKVAQFHPRDAKRLRLVDFGGEIDD